MSKGQETRNMIIEKAAVIFNQQGFSGSSMSDVMKATGLEKGGIYRHFSSKDELAVEAFDYAVNVLRKTYREAVFGKTSAEEKLFAVLSVYSTIAEDPPLAGGCPVLNTSIDTDDTHGGLNHKAQLAMKEWLQFIQTILKEGILSGEFRPDLDVDEVSIFLTSAFEGSVMLGKLYNDSLYVEKYLNQMKQYIKYCIK